MKWFRPAGPLFMPASAMGWLLCSGALAFCVNTFWVIDRPSHSISDTLYGIFPFWVPAPADASDRSVFANVGTSSSFRGRGQKTTF